MTTVDGFIYAGDAKITGGVPGVKPSTAITGVFAGPQAAGLALMMPRYQRVVPSGIDGQTGGTYEPYWDGVYTKSWQSTAAGGANTITVAGAQWAPNMFSVPVAKTLTITAGTGSGQVRTVASNTADTITVTANWVTPPDATSVFNLGAGWLIQFQYLKNGPILPAGNGDNWFEVESLTPNGLLMQGLGEMYGATGVGFRMLKSAAIGGISVWNTANSGGSNILSTFNYMTQIEAGRGNTLRLRGIILDAFSTDIYNANLSLLADLTATVASIRANFTPDALIVLVNQSPYLNSGAIPGAANSARAIVKDFVRDRRAAGDLNIVIYDMAWATFAWNLAESITAPPANPKDYDLISVIKSGHGIYNTIRAHYTQTPTPAAGPALVGLAMLGDSQFCTINPLLTAYLNSATISGPYPGSTVPNVWVWDESGQQWVPLDALVGNLFGALGFSGALMTIHRKLLQRWPQGVLAFQYARGGASLCPEAINESVYFERGGPTWDEIAENFAACKVAALQQLEKSADWFLSAISCGENDCNGDDTSIAAYEARVGDFVDDWTELISSRADGFLAIAWQKGAPPSADVAGGSVLGTPERRRRYRARLDLLATEKPNLRVTVNNGPDDFPLSRVDQVHYDGEAELRLGDALATLLLEIVDANDAPGDGATGGEEEEESATDTTPQGVMNAIDAAIAQAAGVTSYTVNGRTVNLEKAKDLIEVRKSYEGIQARNSGLRRTRIQF